MNPFEKANEKKRITELLKERDELRAHVKDVESNAWKHKTTAEILSQAIEHRDKEIAELRSRVSFLEAIIKSARRKLSIEISKIENDETAEL